MPSRTRTANPHRRLKEDAYMPIDETGREYDESWDDAPSVSNLDGTVATIVRGMFEVDEHYKDLDTDELVPVFVAYVKIDGDDGEVRVLYSIGKGWEIVDGGASVTRTDGKPPKFSPACIYKHLVGACVKLNPELKYRSGPRFADLLNGTRWEWADQEIKMGNNYGTKSRALPVKFLGFDGASASKSGSVSASPKAASASDLTNKLISIAKMSDSHQEFVDNFTSDDSLASALKGDKALLRQCLNSGDQGFWAQHHA